MKKPLFRLSLAALLLLATGGASAPMYVNGELAAPVPAVSADNADNAAPSASAASGQGGGSASGTVYGPPLLAAANAEPAATATAAAAAKAAAPAAGSAAAPGGAAGSGSAGNAAGASAGTGVHFNMSYVYFGLGGDYVQQVDAADGALQVVAPSYFELNEDGSLKLASQVNGTFTKMMHDRGIRVVPYLSNDWDRDIGRLALQQRDKLSDDLAKAVVKYGLDGVDIDIENVTEADRDAYTDFIRQLRAKLPAGKELSIAVAPNPDNEQTGWAAAYDYKTLAAYCDYLMLMAYDESYPGDPTPGPVASLPFVDDSIRAALKLVSPDKLVLGVPFYGRLWKDGDSSLDGSGLSAKTIDTLISRYNAKVTYDNELGSAQVTFTIGPNDPVSKLEGQTLGPGSYTVWYENDQSLQAKLALVDKYGLKGTGSWSLGQQTAAAWSSFTAWLHAFKDTSGHWAEADIREAAAQGWMTGEGDGLFAPDQALTRAEAAAVLMRAAGVDTSAVGGATAAAGAASLFADVPASHWAAHDIDAAAQLGYVDGVAAGRFAPDRPITREQMCALLARVLALPTAAGTASTSYRDVPAGSWSAQAIAALSERGVVDGFADGTFRPQAPVTRAQMAALLVRLAPSFAAARSEAAQ